MAWVDPAEQGWMLGLPFEGKHNRDMASINGCLARAHLRTLTIYFPSTTRRSTTIITGIDRTWMKKEWNLVKATPKRPKNSAQAPWTRLQNTCALHFCAPTNVSLPQNMNIENKLSYAMTPMIAETSEHNWMAQQILQNGQWHTCNWILTLRHRPLRKICKFPHILARFHPANTSVPVTERNIFCEFT